MRWIYILRCADNSLYVGETCDTDERLRTHNEGRGGIYTAHRRPVELVYTEPHRTREAALDRERQLKRWTRAKKEALIAGNQAALAGYSQRARKEIRQG